MSEPPSQPDHVTLVSSDGFSYVISREAAMISGTIRGMLESGNFIESQSNRVTLQEISGMILEKVCEYLCYNLKYKDQVDVADFDISPEMSLELLMAADYLDGKKTKEIELQICGLELTNF